MKLKPEIVSSVLDAAESLFNEHGYCPVSLELVAERAGISKRTLYKYFGDKNGLVCEVLIRRDAFFKDSLTNVVAVFNEEKDRINAIVSWHIRWFNSDHYHGCMFIRAQAEYNKNEAICSVVSAHKRWVQNLIYECLENTQSSHEISHLIMLILEGMISYTLLFGAKHCDFIVEKKYIFGLIDAAKSNYSDS